jgi:hypothetical protein
MSSSNPPHRLLQHGRARLVRAAGQHHSQLLQPRDQRWDGDVVE